MDYRCINLTEAKRLVNEAITGFSIRSSLFFRIGAKKIEFLKLMIVHGDD